jgi:hypothetical protein
VPGKPTAAARLDSSRTVFGCHFPIFVHFT